MKRQAKTAPSAEDEPRRPVLVSRLLARLIDHGFPGRARGALRNDVCREPLGRTSLALHGRSISSRSRLGHHRARCPVHADNAERSRLARAARVAGVF
jgi:hypothetical protein